MTGATGMAFTRIAGLLAVAVLLGVGQLLFKLAAERLVVGRGVGTLLGSFASSPMLAALTLYAFATVFWVYLLHGVSLGRAYPFIALAFAIVPLLSWLVFGEALTSRYWVGLGIMFAGLYVITSNG